MAGQIREIYSNISGSTLNLVACGWREVFDAFEDLGRPDNLRFNLLDIDEQVSISHG